MFEWMRTHKLALIVSCVMFAIMAVAMVEVTLATDDIWGMLSALENGAPAWIWRAGGLLTWPVFMWLLLRDRLKVLPDLAPDHMTTAIACCAAAAVYGGGGLWVLSNMLSFLYRGLEHDSSLFLILMPTCTVLPFVYVWVFVAIYGFGQTRMVTRTVSKDWIVKSAIAAVVGVYGIGALIDVALAAVMVPAYVLVSPAIAVGAEDLAFHLMFDLCAIAISTGNFASQWWAFKRVDECLDLDYGVTQPWAPYQRVPQQPYGQTPVSPYGQASGSSYEQSSAQTGVPASVQPSVTPVVVPGDQFAQQPSTSDGGRSQGLSSQQPYGQATAASQQDQYPFGEQKYSQTAQAQQQTPAPVPLQDVPTQGTPVAAAPEGAALGMVDQTEPVSEVADPEPQADFRGLQVPRLVCTCGAELPVDARYLPEVVPACRFCPNCGIQLLA